LSYGPSKRFRNRWAQRPRAREWAGGFDRTHRLVCSSGCARQDREPEFFKDLWKRKSRTPMMGARLAEARSVRASLARHLRRHHAAGDLPMKTRPSTVHHRGSCPRGRAGFGALGQHQSFRLRSFLLVSCSLEQGSRIIRDRHPSVKHFLELFWASFAAIASVPRPRRGLRVKARGWHRGARATRREPRVKSPNPPALKGRNPDCHRRGESGAPRSLTRHPCAHVPSR